MKRLIIYGCLIFMMGAGTIGCYKDVILPDAAIDPDAPALPVSFKNEIAPLVNSKCAISGCHVAGAHKPYMTLDVSYQQMANGGFVNTSLPKESILYQMINGEMQQYIPAATDRQKIYDWIRNGAPNN
ncbi:hypothetical protein BH11BAC3_BH11BAC3_17560 [soil metagenome]